MINRYKRIALVFAPVLVFVNVFIYRTNLFGIQRSLAFNSEPRINLAELELDFSATILRSHEDAPGYVHFGFLTTSGDVEMSYYQYLAIKAAKVNGQAERVFLHYDKYLLKGKWFEKALRYLDEARQTEYDLTSVFGNEIDSLEHRKDVLQLLVLRDFGGVFLDLDMIILRPIKPLLENDFTLFKEGRKDFFLCAVMQSKRTSLFLLRWLESYKSFNDSNWVRHCSKVPGELASKFPDHVTLLEREAAARPWWTVEGHRTNFFDRNFDFKNNFAVHLWNHESGKPYTAAMTTRLIWTVDTSLFCQLRNLTADEEGAGTWTQEMTKDCEIIDMAGASKRVKGLIGHWPLSKLGETMPKVPDFSGNRIHGIVGPLNGYKPTNNNLDSQFDFFIFKDGDHIYLPMLPESSAISFTLQLFIRFRNEPFTCTSNTTVLSMQFTGSDKTLNLHVSRQEDTGIHFLSLTLENWFTNALLDTSERIQANTGSWCQVDIVGKKEAFFLIAESQTATVSQSVGAHPFAAVWLGRRAPALLFVFDRDTDTVPCDMSVVKLFDHPSA